MHRPWRVGWNRFHFRNEHTLNASRNTCCWYGYLLHLKHFLFGLSLPDLPNDAKHCEGPAKWEHTAGPTWRRRFGAPSINDDALVRFQNHNDIKFLRRYSGVLSRTGSLNMRSCQSVCFISRHTLVHIAHQTEFFAL